MNQVFEKQIENPRHLLFGLPNRRAFQVKVTLKAWLEIQGAGASSRLSPRSKKLDSPQVGTFRTFRKAFDWFGNQTKLRVACLGIFRKFPLFL
jgi:hypothetical protein